MSGDFIEDYEILEKIGGNMGLGCTLHHLLSGKSRCWQRNTIAEVAQAHFNDPFPSPPEARSDAPAGLEAVLARMTSKECGARFSILSRNFSWFGHSTGSIQWALEQNMKMTIQCVRTATTVLAVVATSVVHAASFGDEVRFLQKYTPIIVLQDRGGHAQVAVSPAWQGRVMTSGAGGEAGLSFGWINRELIASGKIQPHINVFGGEDRFWLGPEGGQFSIFFAKGSKFELNDWFTPSAIDTLPYTLARRSKSSATFRSEFSVTNYSGTRFDVKVNREVKLLTAKAIAGNLGIKPGREIKVVAYETVNRITNAGKQPWEKRTGLLSVWILGMFNPSPETTIVVPIKTGPESQLGVEVTSDYFGSVPKDRLQVKDGTIFFSGDGNYRSKIGINPKRSKAILGSYDAASKVLTLVQFTQPEGVTDYVNSLWKMQENPFGGDASNSYNDGAPSPGAKPLGPFYELESSSPAAALAPKQSLTHVHRTMHLSGDEKQLDEIANATLGVSLTKIQNALRITK